MYGVSVENSFVRLALKAIHSGGIFFTLKTTCIEAKTKYDTYFGAADMKKVMVWLNSSFLIFG